MTSPVRSGAHLLAACAILAAGAPAFSQSQPAHHPGRVADTASPGGDGAEYRAEYRAEYGDGAATSVEQVERAHAAFLRDGALQLVRPEEEEAPVVEPPEPPGWLRAFGEFIESLAPLFKIIFWVAVIAVAAGIAYFIFGEAIRMRLGFKPKAKEKPADDVLTDIRPDAARARSLLDEADAMAREGRFAEAVHLLLFRSIEDIQERLEGGVPTSLTAREIAGLGKLPDRARRALHPIIRIVEHSFFGGRAVDADGWQNARRSYEDFAFGEGWA